ncbi:MAG: hypothetical protein KBT03_09240 [Bacteroidales bacterium]|nr:hypothetical protein [Candidatus Scybalousia scybalohippi]
MSRIIINYDDDIPDANALHYASVVVSMGRMSGLHEESYCYCTAFKDGTRVLADVTKSGTDVFTMEVGGNDE